MSALPPDPLAPDHPPPETNFGFDPDVAADRALTFVQAVYASGWVCPGELLVERKYPGGLPWAAVNMLAAPLADWERAMNPRRMAIDEFDRMDQLRAVAAAGHGMPAADEPVFAAIALATGLAWVVRLLRAGAVWGGRRWDPRPPFGHLPEGLVECVGRAAHGLRAGAGYDFDRDAGFPRPAPVALADAAREVHRVVCAAIEIQRNLTAPDGRSPDREFELFNLLDQLDWHCARLPRRGYEPCYPDRVWEDGGVSGTCAHAAAREVQMRVTGVLGSAAWAARSEATGGDWRALPWVVPFWSPAARPRAAERFPRFDLTRWLYQLEIERTKLVGAATDPTDRVIGNPAVRLTRVSAPVGDLKPGSADGPQYDEETGLLRVGTYEKKFRRSATRARPLLAAFEKRAWNERVPRFHVGGDAGTLAKDLNDKHLGPDCPILFDTEHEGLFFVWRWKATE